MRTWSCRGSWDGTALDVTCSAPAQGPIAALTRASIHLGKASAFWNHAPPSQDAIEGVQGVQLAVGLGEAPFLRQATFTLWDSVAAMDAYARTGAHLEAIKAAAQHQYFSESMFARFVPISIQGRWKERDYG
jgi:heme-degrading monooxygenase HmoA